jgi:ADP-L-glycero-D-manno-heptose 6-epimerase
MFIVTGAAGFIGANVVAELRAQGHRDLVAVDAFRSSGTGPHAPPAKTPYLDDLGVCERLDREELPDWLDRLDASRRVEAVFHLGACSDTTASDVDFMLSNNLEYTRTLWHWCARQTVPFIYASSAATYGDGAKGFDDEGDPNRLKPLNLYGKSKHLFDLWALEQTVTPPRWAGLKYFNVYGPRETHKGRMASVAFHAYRQILETGEVKLFQSHRPGIPDGGQLRDFVFVEDAVAATLHFCKQPEAPHAPNGLYNVGTGTARSFADLARAVFAAMGREPKVVYIPMPEDLRERYQYFTQATNAKLRRSGFSAPFHDVESGARKYVDWLAGAG